MAETRTKTIGLVGVFDNPDDLVAAAARVRDAGYTRWDCHTPYPVHGLGEAMGLKRSPVSTVIVLAGFTGLALSVLLTGGINAWFYPIHIGGKALFSWQAFIPINFNVFVLFAAVAALLSVVVFCRLFRWHSPLRDTGLMEAVLRDRFALVLQADDAQYSEETARALLEASGCPDIRPLVETEEDEPLL